MSRQVLVAYATRHGSTEEVARAIAGRLRTHDLEVDVAPAAEVEDLDGYDAVVLGGALYMGRWHGDARRFVRRHGGVLSAIVSAVFALGPLTAEPKDLAGARRQLDAALRKGPEIGWVAIAVFGGKVDPAKLRFPFNHMPASDARDWEAIDAWADSLAQSLAAARELAPA
jgi:menaquinone-dependent protoporphyrinogen oxidase